MEILGHQHLYRGSGGGGLFLEWHDPDFSLFQSVGNEMERNWHCLWDDSSGAFICSGQDDSDHGKRSSL